MDDGCYSLAKKDFYFNSTCSFSLAEHEFLIKGLEAHFFSVSVLEYRLSFSGKDQKYPILVLSRSSNEEFRALVNPWIHGIVDMRYKTAW
jgi:hypothetical protein